MPVETREYRAGDETAILDLFARSFPHAPRSLEHFFWKYRQNPFGNERISLTFSDEQLVAHYAGYVVPFFAYGKDVLAHQIGDTMTDVSIRSEEHTSELQSQSNLVCRLLLEKKKKKNYIR